MYGSLVITKLEDIIEMVDWTESPFEELVALRIQQVNTGNLGPEWAKKDIMLAHEDEVRKLRAALAVATEALRGGCGSHNPQHGNFHDLSVLGNPPDIFCEDCRDEALKATPIRVMQNKLKAYEKCVKTLKFYADPENYHALTIVGDRPCGAFGDDFSKVEHPDYDEMPGKAARAALNVLRSYLRS